MSLFGGLFASASQAPSSSLFSTVGNKFAAQPAAPPADTQDAGGSGKKRRKSAAAAAAGVPAVGTDAAAGQQPRKKQRKEAVAAQPLDKQEQKQKQKQQRQEQATGAAEAAAAASGAAATAAGASSKVCSAKGKTKQKAAAAPAAPAASAPDTAPAAAPAAVPASAAAPAAKPDPDAPDERLPRTLFVGNLPATVSRKALTQLFSPCGPVESVRLRSLPLKKGADPEKPSKVPRRGAIASGAIDPDHSAHAYVVFAQEEAVEAALALNMTQFKGHHIRVDRATAKAAKGAVQFDPQRSLFVGNLALDVEDEELIQLFGVAEVEAVRVVRDAKSGEGKGVAFVLFRTQEGSKAAMKQRGVELKNRPLRITRVKRTDGAGGGGKQAWQQGQAASGGGGGGGGESKPAKKRKSGGKRPAVAARKQVARQKQAHQRQ
ncbi:RNA-binding protein 34 [Chlorella vulgaris]